MWREVLETDNGWQRDVLFPRKHPFGVITWAHPESCSQASHSLPLPDKITTPKISPPPRGPQYIVCASRLGSSGLAVPVHFCAMRLCTSHFGLLREDHPQNFFSALRASPWRLCHVGSALRASPLHLAFTPALCSIAFSANVLIAAPISRMLLGLRSASHVLRNDSDHAECGRV